MKFIKGHWYVYTGNCTRTGWNDDGMEFVLDGMPHKCIYGQHSYANFEDHPRQNFGQSEYWDWYDGLEYWIEVDDPTEVKMESKPEYKIINDHIDGFELNHWYIYVHNGARPDNWHDDMEVINDGYAHQCIHLGSIPIISTFDILSRDFYWGHVLESFKEVDGTGIIPREIPRCPHCGGVLSSRSGKVHTHDGEEKWCTTCMSEYTYICTDCGDRHVKAEMEQVGCSLFCTTCAPNWTVCDECGDTIRRSEAHNRRGRTLCSGCDNPIHNHAYKPEPNFIGSGTNRFYGMELEVDNMRNSDVLEYMLDKSNDESTYYLKHDGSLDNGFEIVTHPMTFEEFIGRKDFWKEITEKMVSYGLKSHDCRTCGLHFHVSRKGFGRSRDERDECIKRVIYLFEKYFDNFLKLSRRNRSDLDRWAKRYLDDYEEVHIATIENRISDADRYYSINLQNSNTVEFRFFRGTLIVDTLIASIQLLNNLIDVAKDHKDDLGSVEFQEIITKNNYTELQSYALERKVL